MDIGNFKKTLWIVSNTDTMAGCYSDAMTCGSLDDAVNIALKLHDDLDGLFAIKIEDGQPSIATEDFIVAAATAFCAAKPDPDCMPKWVMKTAVGQDYRFDAATEVASFYEYVKQVRGDFYAQQI